MISGEMKVSRTQEGRPEPGTGLGNVILNKCPTDRADRVLRVNDAQVRGRRGNSAGLKFQMEPIERYQNVFKANVKTDARKGGGQK